MLALFGQSLSSKGSEGCCLDSRVGPSGGFAAILLVVAGVPETQMGQLSIDAAHRSEELTSYEGTNACQMVVPGLQE